MTLEMDPLALAEKRLQRSQFAMEHLKRLRFYKFWTHVLFSVLFFYFLFLYLGIGILFFFSPSKRKLAYAWMIRHYFKFYFIYRGVDHYETQPLPVSFDKPTLFFTNRLPQPLAPLYLYHLFSTPIIVPLQQGLEKFRATPFIPWAFLGRLFSLISYPDQNFPDNKLAIDSLLKAGYPTVVHFNHNFSDPAYQNRILNILSAFDLCSDSYDCYFLKLTNFENYDMATFVTPIDISVKCISKTDLLYDLPLSDPDAQIRIAEFFEFAQVQVF